MDTKSTYLSMTISRYNFNVCIYTHALGPSHTTFYASVSLSFNVCFKVSFSLACLYTAQLNATQDNFNLLPYNVDVMFSLLCLTFSLTVAESPWLVSLALPATSPCNTINTLYCFLCHFSQTISISTHKN